MSQNNARAIRPPETYEKKIKTSFSHVILLGMYRAAHT